jgi:hypothetical protein
MVDAVLNDEGRREARLIEPRRTADITLLQEDLEARFASLAGQGEIDRVARIGDDRRAFEPLSRHDVSCFQADLDA